MFLRILLAALLSLSLASSTHAQDEDAPKKEAPAKAIPAAKKAKRAAPAKETPREKTDAEADSQPQVKSDDFATLYREWKKLVAKMYQLKEQFQADPSADKKALEAEYAATIKEAQALSEPLGAAAEKAYLAAPNKDPEVATLLFATMGGQVLDNDYENAARIAKMLTENNFEHRELNLLAGLAFFATSDFDNAEKCLRLAEQSGVIDQNGKRYLSQVEKYRELWAKEEKLRNAEDRANNLPKVRLTTSKGDIVVVLFENEAPQATANFISLVEKKFYDGLTFHRVMRDFMAQGGDPKGDGSGGPGYTIPCECYQENHRNHFRGSLAMAKTQERDSAGSQFYLSFMPAANLDGQYTVFGRVVEGFDVLAKLKRIQPGDPGPADQIVKATVLQKRNHRYEPIKRMDKDKSKPETKQEQAKSEE